MNRLASRLLLCLFAVCALPSLCAAQTTQSSAPAVWKPDPKLLAQLGPEVTVGDYKIRPPQGYTLQPEPQIRDPSNLFTCKTYKYKSQTRADGSRAILLVVFETAHPNTPISTVQQSINLWSQGIKNALKNCATSPAEQGFIAELPFVRDYYTATNPQSGQMLHGFTYIMLDGNTTIHLVAADNLAGDKKPYSIDTLPLAEAAALTFRKG